MKGVVAAPAGVCPPRFVYLCNLVLDESLAFRNPQACTWSDLRQGAIYAPWMVEDSQFAVSHCLWWYETRTQYPEIVHGFNKALPQPCQTRRLKGVLEDIMGGSLLHRRFLREWMVCSLMGQYDYIPQNAKLTLRQRDDVQYLARSGQILIDEFIAHCPWTMMFSLRERMCYSVLNDPPLCKNLAYMFPLESFTVSVRHTMDEIRRRIRGVYPLVTQYNDTGASSFLDPVVWADLEAICRKAHAKILPLCYQRQRAPFFMDLHTQMRGKSGSFEMRVLDPVTPEQPDPHAQLTPAEVKNMRQRPFVSHEVAAAIHRLVQVQDPMTPSIAKATFKHLHHLGVPKTAIDWIQSVAVESDHFRVGKRLGRSELRAFKDQYPYSLYVMQLVCMEWFKHSSTLTFELPNHYRENQLTALAERLHVPPFTTVPYDHCFFVYCEVCGRVYSLHNSTPRHQDLGISEWPRQTPRMRKKAGRKGGDPDEGSDASMNSGPTPARTGAAVNQTSATASGRHPLLHEHTSPSPNMFPPPEVMRDWVQFMHHRATSEGVTTTLHDFWKHPGEASRGVPTHLMPASALKRACETKKRYDADNKDKRKKPKTAHTNTSTYGFDDVVFDFFTDQMRCGKNARRGHLRCSEQKLLKVMLVGRALLLHNRLWLLCPQEGCGLAMVYDSRYCAYTERGVACYQCTVKLARRNYQRLCVLPPLSTHPLRCEMCSNLGFFTEKSNCYVYPQGVLLCETHHSPGLQQFIRMQFFTDRDSVVRLIYGYHARQKENRRKLYARSDRTSLQRRRKDNRTRSAFRFSV